MWGRSRLILATLKPTHCSVVDRRPTDNVTPVAALRRISLHRSSPGLAGWRVAGCGLQVISSDGLGGRGGQADGCDHG